MIRLILALALMLAGCMGEDEDPVLSGAYQIKEPLSDGDSLISQYDFGPGDALRGRSWGPDETGRDCLLIEAVAKWRLSGDRLTLFEIKGHSRDLCSEDLGEYADAPDITHTIRNITATSFELKADRDSTWGLFRRP